MAASSNADIVNEWFRERLSSGPLARSTEGHNQLVAALPALIATLDAAAKPPKAPKPSAAASTAPPPSAATETPPAA